MEKGMRHSDMLRYRGVAYLPPSLPPYLPTALCSVWANRTSSFRVFLFSFFSFSSSSSSCPASILPSFPPSSEVGALETAAAAGLPSVPPSVPPSAVLDPLTSGRDVCRTAAAAAPPSPSPPPPPSPTSSSSSVSTTAIGPHTSERGEREGREEGWREEGGEGAKATRRAATVVDCCSRI